MCVGGGGGDYHHGDSQKQCSEGTVGVCSHISRPVTPVPAGGSQIVEGEESDRYRVMTPLGQSTQEPVVVVSNPHIRDPL